MQEILSKRVSRQWVGSAFLMTLLLGTVGCSHFRVMPADKYVYVTVKQTFLRDRVAAVSNRTGTVENGEKLIVLDRARRFLKVQTPNGVVGWIEERQTAAQDVVDKFEALGKDHEKDPVVATATASDEAYLHAAPGRETEKFYLLAENDSLSLLEKASVPKPVTPGAQPPAPQPIHQADITGAPAGPVMEDWWLVRDAKGQTGWIYGRLIDVSTPDVLLRYANGQRIVGAYVLAHVDDPDSGVLNNGNVVASIPEYLTVLSPFKAGLPYDFNQVRVFIWNTKKHRYETGFSDRNIAGYLPTKMDLRTDPYEKDADGAEKLPSFTYRVLAGDQPLPMPDPATGLIKPGKTIEKTYRLEGNICRRVIAPGIDPPAEAHPDPVSEKKIKAENNVRAHRRVRAVKKVKVAKKRKR